MKLWQGGSDDEDYHYRRHHHDNDDDNNNNNITNENDVSIVLRPTRTLSRLRVGRDTIETLAHPAGRALSQYACPTDIHYVMKMITRILMILSFLCVNLRLVSWV